MPIDFSAHVDLREESHYWFIIVADCFLEEYDAHPPQLDFEIEMKNGMSHLPSDESGMHLLHLIMFILMLVSGIGLCYAVMEHFKRSGQIHLAVLLVVFAYVFQLLAVLCELIHLWVYMSDGKGLRWRHSWIPMDFLSDVYQNLSELIASALLVAVACGWTLVEASDHSASHVRKRVYTSALISVLVAVLQLILEAYGRG
jgi:hypothetical protein